MPRRSRNARLGGPHFMPRSIILIDVLNLGKTLQIGDSVFKRVPTGVSTNYEYKLDLMIAK